MLVVITRKDIAYGLVIVWALGIAVKQSGSQNIVILAQASAIIILLTLSVVLLSKLKKR